MAETNPYRIEEEKWTPNSVYEILPPNTVSWTNYQYSEGSDNVDSEKAHNSLLSGVVSFFGNLLGGVGQILGGAVEVGVGILGGIVEGVTNLIGGFARAVGSIFGGGNNKNIEPPEPIFNPIKTNLEGAIQPHLDDIEEAKGKIEAAQQEQESIKEDIAAHGRDLSTALSKADKGIADAKTAQEGVANAVSQLTTVESALKDDISDVVSKAEEAMAEIGRTNEALQANAKTTADLIADLQTDFSAEFEEIAGRMGDIISTQDGLADGLSKAATQADYNKLNEILWGEQVDLNKDQQELNKRRRDWEEGASLALEKLSDGAAAQTKWNQGAETAIDALARIMGLNLGGRNLLKKSNVNVTNGTYNITRAYFGDSVPEDGEEITISLKGSLGEGKSSFGFYNSGGSTFVSSVPASDRDSNGIYKVVTKWKSNSTNSHLNIYAMPNSVAATSTVEWVKLERGNQATDWTPAPEDIPTQAEVDELQNNAISKLENVTGTTVNTVDALKAAVDSIEQIVGLDNAYRTQQEEIDQQQNERQDLIEKIQELQGQMIPRTILYENSGTVYDDYVEISSGTIEAKGTWVGEMIRTSNYSYKDSEGVSQRATIQKRYSIPNFGSRNITEISTGSSTRVDYWVYPGKSKSANIEGDAGYVSGKTYTGTSWGRIASFTMPENTGESTLRWETRLLNADRGVTYHLRLLVNGTPELTSKWSGKGPLFPWGSGVDYLRPRWELNIPSGATVRIEGAVTGSAATSTRAQASHNRGILTWIEMPKGDT